MLPNLSSHEKGAAPLAQFSESLALQYATFSLAGRLYGIDVTRVQEVVRPMPLTRVPLAPPYIRGLINLRGCTIRHRACRELNGFVTRFELVA